MTNRPRLLPALLVSLTLLGSAPAQEPAIGGKTKTEWLAFLKETNARKREAAVVALGAIGAKDRNVQEAFRDLLLNDMSERVRLRAVTIVQDFDKENLRVLIPTLGDVLKGDKSAAVRAAAATGLGKSGEPAKSMINIILGALKDADASVRAASADAIGRIGLDVKAAVPPLNDLLKDADAGVRVAAVFALGRLGPDGAASTSLLSVVLIEDKDPNVRKETARSLGLLGLDAKSAVASLAKSLKEDSVLEVRQQSALALGKMSGELKSVSQQLIEILKADSDKSIRVLTVQALANGLGADLKIHLKELSELLVKDPEGEVRLAIVQEIGNLGPDAKEALPALVRATTDVQITIREAAKVAVKKVKGS